MASLVDMGLSCMLREHLTLVKKIGEGGFGSVYHMVWKTESGNDIPVAAKRLYKVEDMELQILAKLDHPNIVKLLGTVPGELDFMLIFELCDGGSLRSFLNRNDKAPLSAKLFRTWSKQAVRALQYLHEMKIVHKDVKCENYLIANDNILKLADFGLAKEIDKTVGMATHRATWTHMAPELLQSCELSIKFDIFAFGVVVWEMLTGQFPYEGMGYQAIVWHVCQEKKRLNIPAGCPKHLCDLMTSCWQEDQEERPSSDQVLALLENPYTEEDQQKLRSSQQQIDTGGKNNAEAHASFIDSNESHVGVWEFSAQFCHQDGPQSSHLKQAGGIRGLRDNHIAISDTHAGYINICDDAGKTKLLLPIDNQTPRAPEFAHYSPHDIVASSSQYFATDFSCFVKIYDFSGKFVDKFAVVSPTQRTCTTDTRLAGLAIDNQDCVLVSATLLSTPKYQGFISKHTQSGSHISTIPLADSILPQFIAVTSLDNIIVSSWSPRWMPNTSSRISPNMTVQILHESGQILHTLAPPDSCVSFWRPTGICCSKDTIFIANDNQVTPYEYGIYCFSILGEFLGCATKDVVNPIGIAVMEDGIHGNKLIVTQNELGNHLAGCGLHGVKVFHRK